MEADNAELTMQCNMLEKHSKKLQEELINSQANYKSKIESLNKKEEELAKQADMLVKLLDPEVKKARDEPFAELEKARNEISKLREQVEHKQNKPDTDNQS
jgi:uncharacterized coiled-coil DUF342 family protein